MAFKYSRSKYWRWKHMFFFVWKRFINVVSEKQDITVSVNLPRNYLIFHFFCINIFMICYSFIKLVVEVKKKRDWYLFGGRLLVSKNRSNEHSKNQTGDSKACWYTGSPSYLCIGTDLQSDRWLYWSLWRKKCSFFKLWKLFCKQQS